MKVVVQLKLTPSPVQVRALESTLYVLNEQATWVSEVAFDSKTFGNFALRKKTYAQVRAAGIGSQAAQHVIKKVADAYTTLRANLRNGNYGKPGSKRRVQVESKPIAFRPGAAQPYDQRNLSFALDAWTVSLWTLTGRLKDLPFVCSPEVLKMLGEHKRGEADLLRRDGTWFLVVTLDVPEAKAYEPDGFLGVDLGMCAVRRPVVNSAQSKGIRKEIPGLTDSPGGESQRGQQHVSKAEGRDGVRTHRSARPV